MNKGLKNLKIFLIIFYIVTLIPLIVIGFYNWPSVDDFSMALEPHRTFVQTGNIFATFISAINKTIYIYYNWVGYFFSSFLTTLSPSIYRESFALFTPIIILAMLTIGVLYFFHSILVHALKLPKDSAVITSIAVLLMIIQSMNPGIRVEAFYWYSGAINYMFMFGLALFYLGFLIKMANGYLNGYRVVLSSILGFLLGGCNYMTALCLAVLSVGTIIAVTVKGTRKLKLFYLPSVLNILGLVISAIAPGNAIRSSASGGLGAVESILLSLKSTITICVMELLRWEIILIFLALAVLFWNIAPMVKMKFRFPIITSIVAYGAISANMTPPLYATGNLAAPRIYTIVWAQFILVSALTWFFLIVWTRQRFDLEMSKRFRYVSLFVLAVLFLYITVTHINVNNHYYAVSSAIVDLSNGSAAEFAKENEERLLILNDDSIKEALLPEHNAKPSLLYHEDVYPDKSEWVNTAVAKYYNKDSVALIPR